MTKQPKPTKSYEAITLRKNTHKRLKNMKHENNTYGEIINNLLDHWDKTHKLKQCITASTKNHRKNVKEWVSHTINLDKNTKMRLRSLGNKDDTYDYIINSLVDHWDKTHKNKGELE